MNAFNDDRREDKDDVSAMLNDLPHVDPPASLTGAVMSAVARLSQPSATQPRVHIMRRGSTMAKKVLWSVAAAAAIALVALRMAGYPPVEKGTEATIGAAQRYQAPQVAAADVKVQDQQFQDFLQSDLFRQLANDKAAQEALKNPDVQRALTDANVQTALSNEAVRTAISNNASYFANNSAVLLANTSARNDVIASLRLDANTQAVLLGALNASPNVMTRIMTNANLADVIAHSSLAQVFAQNEAANAVSQQAVLNAILSASPNARNDAVNNVSNNASGNIINK